MYEMHVSSGYRRRGKGGEVYPTWKGFAGIGREFDMGCVPVRHVLESSQIHRVWRRSKMRNHHNDYLVSWEPTWSVGQGNLRELLIKHRKHICFQYAVWSMSGPIRDHIPKEKMRHWRAASRQRPKNYFRSIYLYKFWPFNRILPLLLYEPREAGLEPVAIC